MLQLVTVLRGTRLRRRFPGLQIRVALYIIAIALLFWWRGQGLRGVTGPPSAARADSTLRIAGSDLAPALIAHLAAHYRLEYPRIAPRLDPGGTHRALEDLLRGAADVGFLARPPTREEQSLCREVRGDTLLWYPAALGGIALLRGGAPRETLSVEGLRGRLDAGAAAGAPRVYAPDPNSGLWAACLQGLQLPDSIGAPVVFLGNAQEVMEAVRADPAAWGVVSTLDFPDSREDGSPDGRLAGTGLTTLALRASGTGEGTGPDRDAVASGAYPLFHYLYIALPGNGDPEGGRFLTYVTSAHGQRSIERAGFLPARLVGREIYLTPRSG